MIKNKLRKAVVRYKNEKAGTLERTDKGYRFTYEPEFIANKKYISFSLPPTSLTYESKTLFPFFLGLLPEGWYLDLVCSTLKIDKNDKFGILLSTCKDTIGAVSIEELG